MPSFRSTALLAPVLALTLLGGCAALGTISSDVSSYGEWPTTRKAGTYAFERLPSQQAQPAVQEALESAARPALEAAGFTAAPTGAEPEVLVQVGGRITRTDAPWDDPLWWRGGFGTWRHGPWIGSPWGLYGRADLPRYDREVAVLIRDRSTGKPLYETRATNGGSYGSTPEMLRGMFAAAMKDFPATGLNPRVVRVPLDGR